MRMSYAFTGLLAAGLLTFTYACSDDASDGGTAKAPDGGETTSGTGDGGASTGSKDAGADARDASKTDDGVDAGDAGDAGDASKPPEPPKVMVVRAGKLDGTKLGTLAADVFLDEYDLKTNTVVRTITLPTADNGDNRKLVLTSAAAGDFQEGALSRAPDGRSVTLTGYSSYYTAPQALPPFVVMGPDISSAPRVVGNVQADGTIDTSTLVSDSFAPSTIGGAVRSGTDVWIAGTNGGPVGPVQHLTFRNSKNSGATGGDDIIAPGPTHQLVRIFEGQLYATTMDGKLVSVGTALPRSPGQTETTLLEGLPAPFEFEFLDLDTKPGADRVYIALSSADGTGGGVARYDYDATAKTWSLVTTFTNGMTKGAYGLTAYQDGTNVVLLTTTREGDKLLRFVDKDGTASTSTVVATAPTGVLYRGVTISPAP